MEKKKNEAEKPEYEVFQEKLLPPKESKTKALLRSLGRVVLYAFVFGVLAGAVFAFTERYLIKKWGLDGTIYPILSYSRVTPVPTPEPTPDMQGGDNTTSPTPEGTLTPQVTVALSENKTPSSGTLEDLNLVNQYYAGINRLAEEVSSSIVSVNAITEGVDWFEQVYETRKRASGLYVGNNGVELLFLVSLDSIEGATKYEITLKNGEVVTASLFAYDSDYRIAILSVAQSRLNGIAQSSLPTVASIEKGEIFSGMPVIILGYPNQHEGAIEFGFTTGVKESVLVADDQVSYFTTNVSRYADGDGFVYNLQGQVIGMTSSSLNRGEAGVFSAATLSEMTDILERMLNKKYKVYCGVRGEEVSEAAQKQYNVPKGIYVDEVIASSPALTAGLKSGDIITKVGGTSVTTMKEFHNALNSISNGKYYYLTISRENGGTRKEQTIQVQFEIRTH